MLPAHYPRAWTIVTAEACKTYCPKETSYAAEALCATNTRGDLTLGAAEESSFLSPNRGSHLFPPGKPQVHFETIPCL